MTEVRARTWDILRHNLSDLLAMSDPEAAEMLNTRMGALEAIHTLHERTYAERVVITREFERRELWRHLTDPETGVPFANFTAWMSCSDFLGCRRVNFEALRDAKLLVDVAPEKLMDLPKANIKMLTQLSTQVRNQPDVLEAARMLPREAFEEKVEKEHPYQHVEARKPLRFTPGRSGAKVVEETIAYALEHDIAGTRDEALVRMAETALHEWQLYREPANHLEENISA